MIELRNYSPRTAARALVAAVRLREARSKKDWKKTHEVIDEQWPKLRRVLRAAFRAGREAMNRGELEAALTMRQEREVFEIVNRAVLAVEDELRGPLELVLAATFAASGGNAAKRLARIVSRTALRAAADFEFDAKNKRAQRWVEEHATDLIRGISKTSRERIKDLLSDAFDGDMTVSDVADEIAEELGDDARAETIARTEAARAANAGQVEAWDQAVEEGLLTGQEKKEWITTPDDRLCPICEPMDGVQVDLDEDFNVDGERMSEPPAHPNCRCTIGIVLAN